MPSDLRATFIAPNFPKFDVDTAIDVLTDDTLTLGNPNNVPDGYSQDAPFSDTAPAASVPNTPASAETAEIRFSSPRIDETVHTLGGVAVNYQVFSHN